MSLKDTFCPSPWFHMRINNRGHYEFCRWAVKTKERNETPNITEVDPETFFRDNMKSIRSCIVNGDVINECAECMLVDKHKKVSGRQRQLLKIGVQINNFEKSLLSSAWIDQFKPDGSTDLLPVDWQIDLGNFCNASCIFCTPVSSSKIASEWKKLGFIKTLPENSWCDDEKSLSTFIDLLIKTPNLRYLHFIGGETLITPAYKKILEALVKAGQKNLTIGFTTNLTVWDESIINLMSKFDNINVGLSIETLHPVNDYVRYPSKIKEVKSTLDKWVEVVSKYNWLAQIRITPTVFTVGYLDSIYDYALTNNLSVESCNFLNEPAYMRPSVLPESLRHAAIDKLTLWIRKHETIINNNIINTRNPNTYKDQLIQDAKSYVNYLTNEAYEIDQLPDLIKFIKTVEKNRNNSILDYLPEYEEFLRTAGY
jgi:hypothetical protein